MKTLISLILITFSINLLAQDKQPVKEGDVYWKADVNASPKVGLDLYLKQIAKTIKYPKEARKKGIEGRVFVEMIIDKQGEIESMKVIKGIGSGCDETALDAIRNSGKWKPGIVDNQPVKQKVIMPITFALGKKTRPEK